jgi:hypothetical protein
MTEEVDALTRKARHQHDLALYAIRILGVALLSEDEHAIAEARTAVERFAKIEAERRFLRETRGAASHLERELERNLLANAEDALVAFAVVDAEKQPIVRGGVEYTSIPLKGSALLAAERLLAAGVTCSVVRRNGVGLTGKPR